VAGTALALVGVLYRGGGADPTGFDCSGFVQYVFAQRGIPLPRSVGDQSRVGIAILRRSIVTGDLVFFSTAAAGPSHVGIALGPETFIHAPSSKGQVRVERMSAPYWADRFVAARRVASPGG
jgi:cell wall-associated NlpC family hydrolase